jgi:5-methylcytosine-specific restriction endonuclease McrA
MAGKVERVCPACGATYLADSTQLARGKMTSCSRACSYRLRAAALSAKMQGVLRVPPEQRAAKKRAKNARFRERHRDELGERQRRYYLAHRDERMAATRAWQRLGTWSYVAIKFANAANQRARGFGATGHLYGREVKLIVGPCAYCGGEQASWDHAIPLSRGGANTTANLVPCCFACNKVKADRTPDEWRGPTHGAPSTGERTSPRKMA